MLYKKSGTTQLIYNVFVESSGSMKGHLIGVTEFENVISDLFNSIIQSRTCKNIDFHF